MASVTLNLSGGPSNTFQALMVTVQQSIRENNDDRRAYLQRLRQYNAISELLLSYLEQSTDASQELSEAEQSTPYRCKSEADPSSWIPLSPVPIRIVYPTQR